jgi:dipeptidyl-peptidase 4
MSDSASDAGLSVDRIYDTPSLSGVSIGNVSWSPDGGTLGFIRGEDGRNELWAYDLERRRGRVLFDFAQLQDPAVDEAYQPATHGGRPTHHWHNRVSPAAQIAYRWAGSDRRLLITTASGSAQLLDTPSGELSPLSRGAVPVRDARIAPNGRLASFVRGWELFLVDLATGSETPLTAGSSERYRTATPDTMGGLLYDAGHWWSPDSTQIAYLQTDEHAVPLFWYADLMSRRGQNVPERFPQPGDSIPAMVLKVVSRRGHRWIDTRAWPGHYLARVSWLPDSRHLALQMLSRRQDRLCLVLADSFTGATRTVLVEEDPAWVNVADDLRFFADGRRFLWSSERESLRHLYVYDVDGTELAQLTSGPQACVAVEGLDEANGMVYYLTWPEPHTEARLERVSFRSGGREVEVRDAAVVTQAPGSHFVTLSPDCAHFADHVSTAVQPPRLDLCDRDGTVVATVEANPCTELASYDLRPFTYPSVAAAEIGDPSDAMPLYAKLLEPTEIDSERKHPVIVYVYGGPLPGGLGLARNALNYWRPVPELWMQMMARRGFGIFSLDNRGSNAAPRGHAWETPIRGRLGRVELADQLEGVAYLKSLDWVDPDRLGLLGGSFGGFMTLNAMLRAAGVFRAAAAFAPVTDWSMYDSVYTERYMDLPANNAEGYEETALLADADRLKGDLLLIHGAADPNVHVQHTIRFMDRLVDASKRFQVMLYPTQEHMSFFGMGQSPARLWAHITTFFVRALGEPGREDGEARGAAARPEAVE